MYYELRFPGRRAFDEEGILSELSAPLMHEVRLPKSTYMHMLRTCMHMLCMSMCMWLWVWMCICMLWYTYRGMHVMVYVLWCSMCMFTCMFTYIHI